MTDLAKQIAAACLDEIQSRPDTPTVDELALIVGSIMSCQPGTDASVSSPSLDDMARRYAKAYLGRSLFSSTQDLCDERRDLVPEDRLYYSHKHGLLTPKESGDG